MIRTKLQMNTVPFSSHVRIDIMNVIPETKRSPKDKWILVYFVLFFGLIIAVNSVFIYFAINSHSGVIIDKPYEKGLSYDETLDKAKSQPKLKDQISFKNDVLVWSLKDEQGKPIEYAVVEASLIREVQDGHDYKVALEHEGGGVYKAKLNAPLKGRWKVRLKAIWNNKQYQAVQTLLID